MKIGIFGGAFDPAHCEHIKIIQKSYIELGLGKLILLPSCSPPHKSCKISPFHARVRMLEAATSGFDYVIIDEREHNSNKQNCAFEILQGIINDYPQDELIYIIGGDSMIKFHTWVRPQIISSIIPIAVVAREGYDKLDIAIEYARTQYGAKISMLSFTGEEVSSSQIKASFELQKKSNMVSIAVEKIIIEEGLYKDFAETVQKLKANISKELYEHSANTVLYAMKLASNLDLCYEEVFMASLLHDCAKQLPKEAKYEQIPPKIVHQFAGADIAKSVYGIENENILDAIRYHTTGKKNMSSLAKLVYSADMLEQGRDFEGVDTLRSTIEQDFNKGFVSCIAASIKKLDSENRDIYYLTKECWEFYNNSV